MNGATAVVWIVAIVCITLVIVFVLATFGPKGRLPRERESNLHGLSRPRPDTPNPGVSERPGRP
jgi:hypothetical protein